MLTLYGLGPHGNPLKPMLTLYEKGIEFTSHPLNAATFEHTSEWFKKINPNGQLPVLDHDGKFITESTVICEYLEDEFSGTPSLRPADSYGRAQMRIWSKWVDEYFCWCVSTIGWHRHIRAMVAHLGDEEFEKMVERVPLKEQQVKWRHARAGFPQETVDEEMRKIAYSVKKLEARLATSPWLAGGHYTLADICNFAIANGMQNHFPELVNGKDTPHLLAWIKRINERPACKLMFAKEPLADAQVVNRTL
jgi:glutathione S-transferase